MRLASKVLRPVGVRIFNKDKAQLPWCILRHCDEDVVPSGACVDVASLPAIVTLKHEDILIEEICAYVDCEPCAGVLA